MHIENYLKCKWIKLSNQLQHNKDHILQTLSKYHSQWWKPESISSKIRNKTRMSTVPTIIHHILYYMNGEGNGTPLQYSCLENPMDGGAW